MQNDSVQLDGIIKSLGIEPLPRCWSSSWEASQSTYPGHGNIFFLKNEYLSEMNGFLGFPSDLVQVFLKTYEIINNSPYLSRFAWHCHYLLFQGTESVKECVDTWPSLEKTMGGYTAMFPAVICISGLPELAAYYEEKSIPHKVFIDTVSDVRICMEDYRDKHGSWGLELLFWLINHFSGRLYQLGRLQFMYGEFKGDIHVFKHIITGQVIALANDGVIFRADGLVDGTNGIHDKYCSWMSSFRIDDGFIEGYPVLPQGCALRKKVRLLHEEWKKVLSNGEPVMEVHISKSGKMEHELCRESYSMAIDFFQKYFNNKSFAAFDCNSWLSDPQFQKMLSLSSNIVKFQRDFYIYPVLYNDDEIFKYIFNGKPADLSKAPRDTFLRRAVLDYMLAGGYMHSCGGFILKDDLAYGPGFYQNTDFECLLGSLNCKQF